MSHKNTQGGGLREEGWVVQLLLTGTGDTKMRGMGSSEHLLYAHSRLPHTGREHRGTLLGLEVSTELVGSKRSEQWGQLSAALSLNNVRLKSTADWTYVRCGGEAVTTA